MSRENYVLKRNIAEQVKKTAKWNSWRKIAADLEADLSGTKKLIYTVAKNYRKEPGQQLGAVKSKEGELITDPGGVDDRWREYFQELLNVEQEDEEPEEHVENLMEEPDLHMIRMEELEYAIKKMKNGKASGIDEIPDELLKQGGEGIKTWLYRIVQAAWAQNKIPSEWGKALICPLFKKGERQNCKNYRGISLLCHVLKIYEKILERRLREIVEGKLKEEQYGFRPNRSTIDPISVLRMLTEKSIEWNKPLYIAFLDLKKAFDRVPRSKMWDVLADPYYEVSVKLSRNIKAMYNISQSVVVSQYGHGSWFYVNSGVRQGSVLSSLLFVLIMDSVMREIGNTDSSLVYADDVGETAWSECELREAVERWNEALMHHGMEINAKKSEVMVVSRTPRNCSVSVGETRLKETHSFNYLGAEINREGLMEGEITARIRKFGMNLQLLYPLLRDSHISRRVKTTIYTTILRPILMYGSETWSLTTKLKSRIQAAEMRILRLIHGVTKLDRVRNTIIRQALQIESILDLIERNQLRWFGHVKRKTHIQ